MFHRVNHDQNKNKIVIVFVKLYCLLKFNKQNNIPLNLKISLQMFIFIYFNNIM